MQRLAVSLALSRRNRPEELLLVERSKKLRNFAGVQAFPGGTLDAADEAIPVRGINNERLAPFVVAGARELFEETGLWLGRGGKAPDAARAREDRRRLLAEEVGFAALLEQHVQHLDASDLMPLCRITTPPFSPVRYDTWFLRGLVPEDAKVDIWEGELVAGAFVEPAAAIDRWRRGEIHVAPPIVMMLDEWARGPEGLYERVRDLTESYERGKIHRVYFSPGVLLVALKTPTVPPATHTNTYVVGEERLFVVDPSPIDENEQTRLWEFLDELIAEGRTLEGIFLTHYHPDHVGALEAMERRYDVRARAHPDCMRELPNARFDAPLAHGDTIALGSAPDGTPDWTLTAYHVPGHARGHLAFQESRYGAILVGDLVSTISSILIDPRDGHLETYLESLKFLESVTRSTLYPGHGPAVPDGRKVIRKALEHRREQEAQLLDALGNEPQTASELVAKIYTDVPEKMHRLAERSLLSGLVKLEEEGRVQLADDGYALV